MSFGASPPFRYPRRALRRLGARIAIVAAGPGRARAEDVMPPAPPSSAANERQTPANAPALPADTRRGPVVLEGKVVVLFRCGRGSHPGGARRRRAGAVGHGRRQRPRRGTAHRRAHQGGARLPRDRIRPGRQTPARCAPRLLQPARCRWLLHRSERESQASGYLGITPIGAPVRKKQHTEILARLPDGRMVYVSLDRSDRLWRLRTPSTRKATLFRGALTRDDYVGMQVSFSPTGVFEQKRKHVELEVTNRRASGWNCTWTSPARYTSRYGCGDGRDMIGGGRCIW